MASKGYGNGVAGNHHPNHNPYQQQQYQTQPYNQQNGVQGPGSGKPIYALEHLVTFKVKSETEIRNPIEKMKLLIDLDKTGALWPQKMYMCFSGQWLLMLDSGFTEIENFPHNSIMEPTAFISQDPEEVYNNILVFSVGGMSLRNAEMHIFQVTAVSATDMVEDLKQLASGQIVTIDRNATPINLPKAERAGRDQYGIAAAAAEAAAEKNAHDREQLERDTRVINHCFEDIERFILRLQYAAASLRELENRKNEHNPHGEGLLVVRSRPPIESEFADIFAKIKLALIYIVKLRNHFEHPAEPIANVFISLETIVGVCNDVYFEANIAENVMNPLLKKETINFLSGNLSSKDMDFWQQLGPNWTVPKEEYLGQKGSFHPIFYDDWSPDWVVDEEVLYVQPPPKQEPVQQLKPQGNWLKTLESRKVKIAEVVYTKAGSNDKELNVTAGEYLEILDDSRKWWKARNSHGRIGYVPNTVLMAHNFEQMSLHSSRGDNDSLASSSLSDHNNNGNNNTNGFDNRRSMFAAAVEPEPEEPQVVPHSEKLNTRRSISMPPIVPVPPPLPPPESEPTTPVGTLKKSSIEPETRASLRATSILPENVQDELRYTLVQRDRRKDLEIMRTPDIYINKNSSPKEVEEWLKAKAFDDVIIKKFRCLTGEELFSLPSRLIEEYFGHKESRRLISQINLQKAVSGHTTTRSVELNSKLAKYRKKIELEESNEIF